MKNSIKITQLLTVLGSAGLMASASAQTTNVIFGTDFEGTAINDNYFSSFGYAYAGGNLGGSGPAFAGGVTAGVGLTNSSAFDAMPDFTLVGSDPNYTNSSGYTFSGTVIHIEFGAPLNGLTPTANVDSYAVNFDAQVQGLHGAVSSTTLEFKTDGAGITLRTNGNEWIRLIGGNTTINSNLTHYQFPLSAMTLASGSFSDLTNSAILATVDSFTVELRVLQETGTLQVDRMPVWGFDNDNQLIIDNFYFTQVGNPPPPPPKFERLIWEVNFDNLQPGNTSGFTFRDGANSATITATTNLTDGVGGTAALDVTADLSSWSNSPPTAFSGFGPTVGHGIPYTLQNTSKSAYRVYWTAKAGGFIDGNTPVPGNASIQFLVPPGTLTPSNAAEAIVLELAPNITLSSNFTSFVFDGANCPIGIFNGGSQALFNQYISQVNLVQVQAQYNGGPDIGTVFGYDADNTMTVDDIKVVELVQGIAPLSITNSSGSLKVSWSDPLNGNGVAKLQSSTNVAGPYVDVGGAGSAAVGSPYTVPIGSSQKFFRAQWVP